MKIFYLFYLFFLVSCGYPDIDTVPNFENMNLSKEEATELCKINNSDINDINNCIKKINFDE